MTPPPISPKKTRLLKQLLETAVHGGTRTVRVPGVRGIARTAGKGIKLLATTHGGHAVLAGGAGFYAGWHTRKKLQGVARDLIFSPAASSK